MKNLILDVSEVLIIKLMFGLYILLSGLSTWLIKYNLNVDFAYLGLFGQLISLLIGIRTRLQPSDAKVAISTRVVLSSLIELIIGPTIAMFVMSYIYDGTVTAYTALFAFLIGAFWEIVWNFLKKYVIKKGENIINNDDDGDIPKTSADGGEPVKGGGQ